MVFLKLCIDYYENNKSLVFNYVLLSSLFYIFTVIIFPFIVTKINVITKHFQLIVLIGIVVIICLLGIFLYFYRISLYNKLFPSFTKHIRSNLVRNFLEKNKINFKDSNVTNDINKIYELSEKINTILLWMITNFIPVFIVSLLLTIYMFYISPGLGTITLLSCITFIYFANKTISDIRILFNDSRVKHDSMISNLDNTYSNLLNIYLNNTIEESISDNITNEEKYESKIREYNESIKNTTTTLRVILYSFFAIIVILHVLLENIFK
jgi:ABC-type multidrug transport system fused ATPase/permease subunit